MKIEYSDLSLEYLNKLQLSSTLELKALQLGNSSIEVEDHVLLLEQFTLLRRSRQHHGLVRSIQLEEYRTLGVGGVLLTACPLNHNQRHDNNKIQLN